MTGHSGLGELPPTGEVELMRSPSCKRDLIGKKRSAARAQKAGKTIQLESIRLFPSENP